MVNIASRAMVEQILRDSPCIIIHLILFVSIQLIVKLNTKMVAFVWGVFTDSLAERIKQLSETVRETLNYN